MSEDEFVEDDITDSSSVSFQLNQSIQQGGWTVFPLQKSCFLCVFHYWFFPKWGLNRFLSVPQTLSSVNVDQDRELDKEEEEELYELASIPNAESSNISSEAECSQSEEPLDKSDTDEKEADSCQSGVAFCPQKNIIEDIRFVFSIGPVFLFSWLVTLRVLLRRKSEFGIGVELNAETQKLMQVHQERLGRSLDRLSTELYSKDTHFVLELIQVAPHAFTTLKYRLSISKTNVLVNNWSLWLFCVPFVRMLMTTVTPLRAGASRLSPLWLREIASLSSTTRRASRRRTSGPSVTSVAAPRANTNMDTLVIIWSTGFLAFSKSKTSVSSICVLKERLFLETHRSKYCEIFLIYVCVCVFVCTCLCGFSGPFSLITYLLKTCGPYGDQTSLLMWWIPSLTIRGRFDV